MPAGIAKQDGHPLVAIPPILRGQFDHVSDKTFFIFWASGNVPLRGAMLTENLAGPAFGNAEPVRYLVDATAPARGA